MSTWGEECSAVSFCSAAPHKPRRICLQTSLLPRDMGRLLAMHCAAHCASSDYQLEPSKLPGGREQVCH